MLEIIEYRPGYGRDVIDMILEIQQKEFAISITEEEQPDLKNVYDFYQRDGGNFWIALADGKVAGTVAIRNIGDGNGALRKMFVKAEYRGVAYGISSKLLSTLTGWCPANGIKSIYLGTTDKFLAAHRFYEKNGFIRIACEDLPQSFPVMAVDSRFYKFVL